MVEHWNLDSRSSSNFIPSYWRQWQYTTLFLIFRQLRFLSIRNLKPHKHRVFLFNCTETIKWNDIGGQHVTLWERKAATCFVFYNTYYRSQFFTQCLHQIGRFPLRRFQGRDFSFLMVGQHVLVFQFTDAHGRCLKRIPSFLLCCPFIIHFYF